MRAVDQPNWRPLETLADTAAGMMLLSPDDFMWMGRVQTTSGVEVELYKLYGISHHVNVDHAGRASRYEPGNGLVCGGCDAVAARGPVPRLDVRANEVFARHRAGRPAGRLCPPVSIGNVVCSARLPTLSRVWLRAASRLTPVRWSPIAADDR